MEHSRIFEYIFSGTGSTYADVLRLNLIEMRAKVAQILNRIPQDNPWITIHDISHIDALWEMLEVLLGSSNTDLDRYQLNPLEGFILGAAFLLHDAAMTIVTINNGAKGLTDDPNFERFVTEDLLAKLGRKPTRAEIENFDLTNEGRTSGTLARLLRASHARNAERLATAEWKYAGETWRIISDDELRADWGPLIGKIAKSHHDDVQELLRLPKLDSIRSGKGVSWKVRPQFLACLLRCADVTQIDHRRAPKFSTAFMSLVGEAALHWDFQSRIRNIVGEEDYIRIYSQSFPEAQADSWWTAFEMFAWAQKELDAVDTFLFEYRLPRFRRRRILGIESPETFSRYVPTDGWPPIRPTPKIGNPVQTIVNLGGQQLYGNNFQAPLRELLMNSFDAILTRGACDENFSARDGKVLIRRAQSSAAKGRFCLEIMDNGIGMDRYVMSEILLDFGRSYWRQMQIKDRDSADNAHEYNPIGQYGIGFFAVFMWTNKVSVISRPHDQERYSELNFRYGVAVRPTLQAYVGPRLPRWVNTCVRLDFDNLDRFDAFLAQPAAGMRFKKVAFSNAIWGMLPLVHMDLEIEDGDTRESVPGVDIETDDPYIIQRRLRYNYNIEQVGGTGDDPAHEIYIVKSQPIYNSNGKCIGRGIPAQITTGKGSARSAITINGFPTDTPLADFCGVVEGRPVEASRSRYVAMVEEKNWVDWFTRCKDAVAPERVRDFAWVRWAKKLDFSPGDLPLFRDFNGNIVRISDLSFIRDFGVIYIINSFPTDQRFFSKHYSRFLSLAELRYSHAESLRNDVWFSRVLKPYVSERLGVDWVRTRLERPIGVTSNISAADLMGSKTVFEVVRVLSGKDALNKDSLAALAASSPLTDEKMYRYASRERGPREARPVDEVYVLSPPGEKPENNAAFNTSLRSATLRRGIV